MAKRQLPSPEVLRQLLRYEPETGKLFWKERPEIGPQWNATFAGKEALISVDKDGYLNGAVLTKRLRAHRVAWAMHYGRWPDREIDHINGAKNDNRIENLREATRSENSMNIGARRNNRSGYKGVVWNKASKKWQAGASINGKNTYLGLFDNIEDAAAAYERAARPSHGQFYNAG